MDWVKNNFLPTVQQRGKAVIDARGASSATSAAKAALDTIIACENVTAPGDCFSAAVASDGAYDVPEGLICGYPLMTLEDGSVEIIRDITLSKFAKEKFSLSIPSVLQSSLYKPLLLVSNIMLPSSSNLYSPKPPLSMLQSP